MRITEQHDRDRGIVVTECTGRRVHHKDIGVAPHSCRCYRIPLLAATESYLKTLSASAASAAVRAVMAGVISSQLVGQSCQGNRRVCVSCEPSIEADRILL